MLPASSILLEYCITVVQSLAWCAPLRDAFGMHARDAGGQQGNSSLCPSIHAYGHACVTRACAWPLRRPKTFLHGQGIAVGTAVFNSVGAAQEPKLRDPSRDGF